MKLTQLKIGKTGRVKAVNLIESKRARLIEMGLREGVKIRLLRKAPFSDPIEIKINSFCLAIRREDAKKIEIERED